MPSLTDIRQQYPQYNDMTDASLADSLYNKFYSDMPRDQFNTKIGYSEAQPTDQDAYAKFTEQQGEQLGNTPATQTLQTEAAKGIPIAGGFIPSSPETEQLEKEHPVVSQVARGAGTAVALAPAMAAAPALFGISAEAPMIANIGAGAASGGALSAADTAARGGSLTDIGKSAAVGGLTGGALPVVGKGVGAVLGDIMDLLKPEAKTAIIGMDPLALEWASKQMKAEGLTDAQIANKINELGPQGFLYQYGPEMKGLAKSIATGPGATEGKQAIIGATEARAAPAAITDRVKQGLDEALGPAENMATVTRETAEARAQGAEDPYNEWRATKITPTPEVKQLTQELEDHGFLDSAKAIAARKSLATGQPVEPMENFFTTGERKDWPTAASWDNVKQAIDDKIAGSYKDYRPTDATRDYMQLKNRVIDTIAKSSPEAADKWEAARTSWANPSEVMTAQERGKQVWDKSLTDDELLYELSNYSQPARDAYKQASRAALEEKLDASVNGDATVTKLLQGKNAADKFRIIAGNKTTDPEKLLNQMKNETQAVQLKKDIGTTSEKEAFGRAQKLVTPDPTQHWLGRLMKRIPYAPHVQNPLAYTPGYGTAEKFLTGKQAAQYEHAKNVLGPILASQGPKAAEYAQALNAYNPIPRGLPAGMTAAGIARALAQPQITRQPQ